MFKDKTLLITGGTGSFGNAILEGMLKTEVREIRIFSRDEKKQDEMRHQFKNSKLKFYIGDVRDFNSILPSLDGVDYVFHAAALKQVPPYEYFPMEVVKTNICGTENVLTACIAQGVKKVVCLSTDKAVQPINAMGISKAMMEKVFIAKSRMVEPEKTLICGTRYGNVMCSRGSVIPLFIQQIKEGKPLTITAPTMTRFIMSLDDAIELVLYAFEHGRNGDLFIQKAPACTINVLAQAVKELFGSENPIKIIGVRHGEKMHETLLTKEERARSIDVGSFYQVSADNRDLNYDKFFVDGNVELIDVQDFSSDNATRLNVNAVKAKLMSLDYIQRELATYTGSRYSTLTDD